MFDPSPYFELFGVHDGFVEALDAADRRHWSKAFVVQNVHIWRAIHQDGRVDKPAAV